MDLKTTKLTQVQPQSFNPIFNESFTFSLERHQIVDSKVNISNNFFQKILKAHRIHPIASYFSLEFKCFTW